MHLGRRQLEGQQVVHRAQVHRGTKKAVPGVFGLFSSLVVRSRTSPLRSSIDCPANDRPCAIYRESAKPERKYKRRARATAGFAKRAALPSVSRCHAFCLSQFTGGDRANVSRKNGVTIPISGFVLLVKAALLGSETASDEKRRGRKRQSCANVMSWLASH